MEGYIPLSEMLERVSQTGVYGLRAVPRKKIMYVGMTANGETLTICSPQSKFHKQGFYWVDITQVQYDVMNRTEKAAVIFRLEGKKIRSVDWEMLKQYLTPTCMRYNASEKNHWKLNLYDAYIKVSGNPEELSVAAGNES